jgi:two-component system, NtrC family, sensor kinase
MQQGRHRLLQRQLKRYVGEAAEIPEPWQRWLDAVNDAYCQADEDRARIEHTLELSSQELLQANLQLQQALQSVEQQVADRTAELTRTNDSLIGALEQLQQTQMQLVQAEKMSSLGQVAAGVAHEINNPVTFIQGNLTYVNQYVEGLLALVHQYQQDYPEPSPQVQEILGDLDVEFVAEDLPKILHSMTFGTERITTIVKALRTFSRLDEAELKSVCLKENIESVLLLMGSRLQLSSGRVIEIVQDLQNLPPIECYAGELNQVFANMIANSIDALEDCRKFAGPGPAQGLKSCPKKDLMIQEISYIQDQVAPKIWIWTNTVNQTGVEICIADNGVGIPEVVQKRLFDPFFTTKPVGQGTGMGLSACHQIITKQHRGQLDCRSIPGWGTVFTIQIPLRQAVVHHQGTAASTEGDSRLEPAIL